MHKANAEKLVDYYYEPEVAAELASWVNYVCPVPAAQHVLASAKDEDTAALAENPLIFRRHHAQAAGDRARHHVHGTHGVRQALERDRGTLTALPSLCNPVSRCLVSSHDP